MMNPQKDPLYLRFNTEKENNQSSEQVAFQFDNLIKRNHSAVCQHHDPLKIIELLHIAGDGNVRAAGFPLVRDEVSYSHLRMI